MKVCCFITSSLLFILVTTIPLSAQVYFQQQTNYKITATLDTTEKTLDLDLDLAYTNNSPDALEELYFHVWWNCFGDKTSAFADQHLEIGKKDFYYADDTELGGYESITFLEGEKELLTSVYIDDNNKKLVDVLRVLPSQRIEPGQTAQLRVKASIKIPALFSRGGWQDDLFRFTQWYPKPAVYDSEGWHPMPYLDIGEFYSEYGDYELTLNLPSNYDLVTTGEVLSEAVIDEMKVVKISATQVPDFAWACSGTFIKKEKTIDIDGQSVDLKLFTKFGNGHDEILGYMAESLKFYSEKVGPYPYPQFSLVWTDAESKGGMEYPMLSIIDLAYLGQTMDNLVAHEIGHNWFQSALGSNERRYPWIDEGFNSFIERQYNASKYPEPNYNWIMPKFYRADDQEYTVMQAGVCHLHCCGQLSKIDQPSAEVDLMTYGTNSYERMAFALRYLESYLGPDIFSSGLRSLYDNWLHKHPNPEAIRSTFEKSSGKDLGWFFEGMIGDRGYYDYKITDVEETASDYLVTITNKENFSLPVHLTAYSDAGDIMVNKWVEAAEQSSPITLPKGNYSRISINGKTPYLDLNRKDNHYRPEKALKRSPINLRLIGQQADSYKKTISILPVLSYNRYNGLMVGLDLHNEFFPYNKTRWHVQPAFGISSKSLAGVFAVEHDLLLKSNPRFQKLTLGVSGRRFDYGKISGIEGTYRQFYNKLRPSITLHFDKGFQDRTSIDYQLHFINYDTSSSPFIDLILPSNSIIHQLNYRSASKKRLREVKNLIQLEYETYADAFGDENHYLKLSIERAGSLHYNKNSKLYLRLFGGYFLANSQRESSSYSGLFTRGSFALTQQGFTDHTFEGFYINRFDQEGASTRQIMIEEGGFKQPLGSSYNLGLSNDYMVAANLKADLPFTILKFGKLRPYVDLGYYSAKDVSSQPLEGQFVFSMGLGFEVGDLLGVYLPLYYSDAYDVPYLGTNLLNRISFKLNFSKLNIWRIAEQPGILLDL